MHLILCLPTKTRTRKTKNTKNIYILCFRVRVFLVQMYLALTTNSFPWLTIFVVLPISAGSLIFFFPHRGNKVIRWYTLFICILELLLMTYAFSYYFQLDDPLIQLM
eukprot:XP_025012100.1 uncharacterized protein LOC112533880 [Ricinus communis]